MYYKVVRIKDEHYVSAISIVGELIYELHKYTVPNPETMGIFIFDSLKNAIEFKTAYIGDSGVILEGDANWVNNHPIEDLLWARAELPEGTCTCGAFKPTSVVPEEICYKVVRRERDKLVSMWGDMFNDQYSTLEYGFNHITTSDSDTGIFTFGKYQAAEEAIFRDGLANKEYMILECLGYKKILNYTPVVLFEHIVPIRKLANTYGSRGQIVFKVAINTGSDVYCSLSAGKNRLTYRIDKYTQSRGIGLFIFKNFTDALAFSGGYPILSCIALGTITPANQEGDQVHRYPTGTYLTVGGVIPIEEVKPTQNGEIYADSF
jgi:hypothetical protein